jgi:hypothetical protein
MKRTATSPVPSPPAPKRGPGHTNSSGFEPIALIDLGEGVSSSEMKVTDAARKLLQDSASASGRPVMVVCVVGRSRTGKSFLMNRGLMNSRVGGFTVSPSTRACTKGLWIAGPPVPAAEFWARLGVQPPAGRAGVEDYDVLVVDTEGINALDRDQSYDVRIFTLALLLSSVFVYNSLGAIDENAISTLSAVASVAESLKHQNTRASSSSYHQRKAQAGAGSALELPSLLWVVRDFALDIEREGTVEDEREKLSDDEYLEEALRADMFDPRSPKGMLRKVLNEAFPCRACQTMVRPAEREDDMKRLQDLSDEELRPEFVEQLASLRRKLFALSQPKRVAGRPVDASLLADLAATYVEAINGDRAPVVADAWTQVTRARCEKGVTQAVGYLEALMSAASDVQLHPSMLHAHVAYGLRTAEAMYRQHIRGIPDTSEFDRQLQQRLLVAVASAAHHSNDKQNERLKQVTERAAELWRDAKKQQHPPGPASFLAAALEAARDATDELVPMSKLPPPEYSHDIIPSVVEDATRKAAENSVRDRWAWLAAERLAASPDLLVAKGIVLPESGVSVEEHALLRAEAERCEQRAADIEKSLVEERERALQADKRRAEAEAALQVAEERAAAAEVSAETRVGKLQETVRLGTASDAAALVAEVEARAEAKLKQTIESYEQDLDERETVLEALRGRYAVLQEELAAGKRCHEDLRNKLSDAERKLEAAAMRQTALETEITRHTDVLAARTAEIQRLTNEHGRERLDWATRLRNSETEAARAAGQAEALATRVKAAEQLHSQLDEVRRALHVAEVALARADAQRQAAEAERDRSRDILARKEDELRDGLRTVKEISRTLKGSAPMGHRSTGGSAGI